MKYKGKSRFALNAYYSLGQFRLPLKSLTTSKFLVQIFKSEKKAFHYFQIEPVNVPNNKYTSKKSIVKMIAQHPDLAKYFPDDPAH